MQGVQLCHSLSVNLELTNPGIKDYGKKYDDEIGIYGSWYMSEKYDGIRAFWTGKELRTRSMRKFTCVPSWFIKKLPRGIPLDGEIIVPNKPFQYFSSLSITKEEDPKWKEVEYKVFDMPIPNVSFEERLNRLRKIKGIDLVEFIKLKNIKADFKKVNEYFRKVVEKGGEGVILIKADSHYLPKRVKHCLKYKKEMSGEAEVIGYCEGFGKYYQKLGKFKCKIPKTGKTFYCGTGLSDELRNMYHFDKTVCYLIDDDKPHLKAPRIGDIITFNCMEILPSGIPRMSVFKGIRTDIT